MPWRDRDNGERAAREGRSIYANPHRDSYAADYDERRQARDWEDGFRMERRRQEEQEEERRRQEIESQRRARAMDAQREEEQMREEQRQAEEQDPPHEFTDTEDAP